MSNSPLFGGDIRDFQQSGEPGARSDQSSQTGPPQPGYSMEYHGWSRPIALENVSLDIQRPQFKPAFMIDSEPHTPIEQLPPQLPGYDSKVRFGSVSSIATTDDEEPSNEILYSWNEQQDQIVSAMYDAMVNNPQTAPFSGRYPPSGVLHRVAKDTLRMAKHKNVYFPHSMNAVRQRVITLYHSEPDEKELMDKFQSSQEYFPMESPLPSSDDFDFTDAIGARRLSMDEKWSMSSTGRPGFVPEHASARPQPSLAAPFKEPPPRELAEAPSGLSAEDVVNIVAKRKRDSLRMKRGVR